MNKILRKEAIKLDTFTDSRINSPAMLERLERNV